MATQRKAEVPAVTAEQFEALAEAVRSMQGVSLNVQEMTALLQDVVQRVKVLEGHSEGEDEVLRELVAKVEELAEKVEGRNKSAPVKRNMTDADAKRVLVGDLRDLAHKEAAEVVGLTYAQVYSCRMEFTFKHVHKELRDSGWRNPHRK